jgi:predicted Zn-dependent protease
MSDHVAAAELSTVLQAALARAGEAEADVYAQATRRGVARFSVGRLDQHMQLEEPYALVRVARGRCVAEVSTTDLDEASLVAALESAARLAPRIPEDPSFSGFAGADQGETPALSPRFAATTRDCDAERRVALLSPLLGIVERAGLLATGALDTSTTIQAVATTNGLSRAHAGTSAVFKIWALQSAGAGGAAGHGQDAAIDVERLELERETARAVVHAQNGRKPIALAAGEYDTVLEAPAVAELIEWLSMIGFGAREFHQGGSPLSGRLGERISGTALTVTEDPLGEHGFAAPFDRDGVTRQRVSLVERGIGRGILCDRAWAARLGLRSTGSGTPATNFSEGGPAPAALVVGAGDAGDTAELVRGIERGLFVRRLHYVNGMLEPRRAVMTGLTRDGTFLIEGGKITRAVHNLRFTDSLLEAFERVDGVTRGRRLVPNAWSESGVVVAPAIRVRRFRFSGSSQSTTSDGSSA